MKFVRRDGLPSGARLTHMLLICEVNNEKKAEALMRFMFKRDLWLAEIEANFQTKRWRLTFRPQKTYRI